MKRLIDYDPITGISTYHSYDSLTDTTTISHESDAEPVLEQNKVMANDDEHWKRGVKQDFVKYASIPAGVIHEWLTKYGVNIWDKNHWKRVGELINHPDYRYLKTTSKYHRFKEQ